MAYDPSIPELVEHLQNTIEALKLAIVRNRKSEEYRKALNGHRRTPHHRHANSSVGRGKSIALTIKALTTVNDP